MVSSVRVLLGSTRSTICEYQAWVSGMEEREMMVDWGTRARAARGEGMMWVIVSKRMARMCRIWFVVRRKSHGW